ncbi:uncharacterized protein [Rutidosis leptorrhynchoides]|uniref:uncharacterized protein n=1 Tax=Rutidosis leptorrhynchoides TaxID=125765 RepID=UPI003A992FFF
MSWVKWDKVLASFENGGLNTGSLKAFNIALVLKWKWRYLTKPDDLWVKIIKSIHGQSFDKVQDNYPSVWSNIVSTSFKHTTNGNIPANLFSLQVGNGANISFWNDLWCGNDTLANREHGSRQIQLFNALVQDIDSVTLSDRDDCWSCLISVDGIYTVKSVRDYIDYKILPVSNSKTSWYKFLPRKVNVFLWRFRLDSLSVRWNLSAKGIDINSVVCPVSTNGVETCDHLFFSCSLASDLWRLLRVWLNCGLPPLTSWDTFIVWLEGVQLSCVQKKKVIVSVVTLLWTLW